jgi:hypothetical protein
VRVPKKDRFPLQDGSEPVEDTRDPWVQDASDAGMLINPCEEDPALHFSFSDEWLICKSARATKMEAVCGLNREDLRDSRRELLASIELAVNSYKILLKYDDKVEANKVASYLKTLITATASFSAMARDKIEAMGLEIANLY